LERLMAIPAQMEQIIAARERYLSVAQGLLNTQGFLFLGRGAHFPIALEGALKLKEVSYMHAEAYTAGEIKHGPLAIIDSSMTAVVIATHDPRDSASMIIHDKMLSSIQEVKSRDGQVLAVATEGDREAGKLADHTLYVPTTSDLLAPILEVVPLQFLS